MTEDTPQGLWLNKRALASIELPLAHRFEVTNEGYDLVALESGKLTLVYADHGRQKVDVDQGDRLRSAGEEFFLSLQRGPKGRDEERPKPGEEQPDEPREPERRDADQRPKPPRAKGA